MSPSGVAIPASGTGIALLLCREPRAPGPDCNGQSRTEEHMLLRQKIEARAGKIRYGLAAILLGLPLPIVILAFLWGGCR